MRPRLLAGISVFWFGLSFLTDGLTALLLPYELLKHVTEGSRATVLGLLTFFALIFAMAVQPFAGALSDRFRHRLGRQWTVGAGLAATLAALAVYSLAPGLAMLAAAYIAVLASASIAQAGQQGLIPDLVPAHKRGLASGFKGFMDVGGAMAAFGVLSAALEHGRGGVAVVTIAAALVTTYFLSLLLVREPRAATAQGTSAAAGLAAFRLDLAARPLFKRIVAARFLFLLGVYMVGRFFLFFVSDRLDLDPEDAAGSAGVLLAALTLITLLAGPPAGWLADRAGRKPLVMAGCGLTSLGTLMLAFATSQWQILIFGTLMALGTAAFTAANWAMTADVVPPGHAGRFFGLANFGTAGAAAIAGLFGPLVDAANRAAAGSGYVALMLAAAIASAAAGAVMLKAPGPSRPQRELA